MFSRPSPNPPECRESLLLNSTFFVGRTTQPPNLHILPSRKTHEQSHSNTSCQFTLTMYEWLAAQFAVFWREEVGSVTQSFRSQQLKQDRPLSKERDELTPVCGDVEGIAFGWNTFIQMKSQLASANSMINLNMEFGNVGLQYIN